MEIVPDYCALIISDKSYLTTTGYLDVVDTEVKERMG